MDLINTDSGPISWSTTVDDSWLILSSSSGTLENELRIGVSIDWEQLPVGENLQSMIHIHQGANTIDVPVSVWNPVTPPASDFIEENGVVSMEAEHFTSSSPGTGASWVQVPGMGRGDGVMIVSPTSAPSLTTPEEILSDAPVLEYSFHLRTAGSHRIAVVFLPALALNDERGRRYAVSVDGETPRIVTLSSQSGSGSIWSRSVLRAHITGVSTHTIASPGVHTLKIWMVDPGLILDRIVIDHGGNFHTYHGARETGSFSDGILRIGVGETWVLDQSTRRYQRIINHGTLEIRSSSLATTEGGGFFEFWHPSAHREHIA